jgi:hypothetical protein
LYQTEEEEDDDPYNWQDFEDEYPTEEEEAP